MCYICTGAYVKGSHMRRNYFLNGSLSKYLLSTSEEMVEVYGSNSAISIRTRVGYTPPDKWRSNWRTAWTATRIRCCRRGIGYVSDYKYLRNRRSIALRMLYFCVCKKHLKKSEIAAVTSSSRTNYRRCNRAWASERRIIDYMCRTVIAIPPCLDYWRSYV